MAKTSLTQCIGRPILINYLISHLVTQKTPQEEVMPLDNQSNRAASGAWQQIAIKENEKKNIPT